MIRFAWILIAGALLAAGLGWLGETGWPPLVVVHEGEHVVVHGPGDALESRGPGEIGFRIPFLSREERHDLRLRTVEVESELGWNAILAWRVTDPRGGAALPTRVADLARAALHRVVKAANAANAAREEAGSASEQVRRLEEALVAALRERLPAEGVSVESAALLPVHSATRFASAAEALGAESTALRGELRTLASTLRAEALRSAAAIRAEAEREALATLGAAEAEAARIYAEAYALAPEFYAYVAAPRGLPQHDRFGDDPGPSARPRVLSPPRSRSRPGALASGGPAGAGRRRTRRKQRAFPTRRGARR